MRGTIVLGTVSLTLLLSLSSSFDSSRLSQINILGRVQSKKSQWGMKTTSLLSTRQMEEETTKTKTSAPKNSMSFVPFTPFPSTDCDDVNTPPSLSTIISSIRALRSGSDIRGQFLDHVRVGSMLEASRAIRARPAGSPSAALTPLAAHCYGSAFGEMVRSRCSNDSDDEDVVICVGQDPRPHGQRLADAFARGAESVDGVRVVYTGIATTPAMFEFCRANMCDGAVMITASHLPIDRNGLKLFTKNGGLTKKDIDTLAEGAIANARKWHDIGLLPPTSGDGAVLCSEWVDFMPHYASTLQNAIVREVFDNNDRPLSGLRVVLNAGHGSGCFFHTILHTLGADVSHSIRCNHDSTFPNGVPNPEYHPMIQATMDACKACHADLGIMLDTDADRAGFIVPTRTTKTTEEGKSPLVVYEALHRNRLIALLSVIFSQSSPGCTIVTDSVTSEGLAHFLTDELKLNHVRYLKGYANVIGKAKEITDLGQQPVAEMAIETSGHCAMRENGYLDDGTYTSVKVLGLLARVTREQQQQKEEEKNEGSKGLLDLISNLQEMNEVSELRMKVLDGSLETTSMIYDRSIKLLQNACRQEETTGTFISSWSLDEENLEGIRARTGDDGGFFMLRKSLHDPLLSLQVEGKSREDIRKNVIVPMMNLLLSSGDELICNQLDLLVLEAY